MTICDPTNQPVADQFKRGVRRWAWSLMSVLATLALALAAPAARANDPIPVRAATSLNVAFAPMFVLGDSSIGIGKKHGLDVRLRMFPTGIAGMEAALAGEIDIPVMNAAVTLPVFVGGRACFKGVVNFVDFGALRVVGKTDIKSVNDLAGKKVGTVPGAIGNTGLHLWMDMHKVPRDKVTIVSVQPQDMIPTLSRGDVDAIVWVDPIPAQAITVLGADKVHTIGNVNEAYRDVVPINLTCKWVEQYGDKGVERFIAAWIEAVEYVKANPEKAANLTASQLRQDPKLILDQMTKGGWLATAWPANMTDAQIDMLYKNAEYLISVKRLDKMPDLGTWIDTKWLKRVAPARAQLQKHKF